MYRYTERGRTYLLARPWGKEKKMSKLIFFGGKRLLHGKIMLLVASLSLTGVLASGVALAALGNTPDSGTVGANGRVWDILRAGDKVYLAGAFSQITDKNGTTFQRNNLAAIDAVTGQVTDWNPSATNPNNPSKSSVRSMALSSDGVRLFVGGTFTRVGGVPRSRLAAINPLTGAVDGGWKPSADRPVHALVVSNNKLYLGGDFMTVAGQPREQLAVVDATTGALDPNWTPRAHRGDDNPKNYVWAMDVSDDGTRIYVGGFFNHISGQRTGMLTALDASTGGLELARIGSDDARWKADTRCSIIRGVTKLPDEGENPCPRSHLTSSSPSGNSLRPCCPKGRWIILWGVTVPASPTEWSSRGWCRCWCSVAPTGASPTSRARPPRFATDATSGSSRG
jgi:hypothetical protein